MAAPATPRASRRSSAPRRDRCDRPGELVLELPGAPQEVLELGHPERGPFPEGQHLGQAVSVLATKIAEQGKPSFETIECPRVPLERFCDPTDLCQEFGNEHGRLLSLGDDLAETRIGASRLAQLPNGDLHAIPLRPVDRLLGGGQGLSQGLGVSQTTGRDHQLRIFPRREPGDIDLLDLESSHVQLALEPVPVASEQRELGSHRNEIGPGPVVGISALPSGFHRVRHR